MGFDTTPVFFKTNKSGLFQDQIPGVFQGHHIFPERIPNLLTKPCVNFWILLYAAIAADRVRLAPKSWSMKTNIFILKGCGETLEGVEGV